MITRRKLFAFSAAVAVSPVAAISADAETRPIVEMVAGDLTYPPECGLPVSSFRGMNARDFYSVLEEGLRSAFDGVYSDMQYYDSWQQ